MAETIKILKEDLKARPPARRIWTEWLACTAPASESYTRTPRCCAWPWLVAGAVACDVVVSGWCCGAVRCLQACVAQVRRMDRDDALYLKTVRTPLLYNNSVSASTASARARDLFLNGRCSLAGSFSTQTLLERCLPPFDTIIVGRFIMKKYILAMPAVESVH